MARRRELKGIAGGIAMHCASRNNDISGYWALGIIYKIATGHGVPIISIDIASAKNLCAELAEFRRLFRERYHFSSLRLYQFISNIVVDFKFEPYSVSEHRGQTARATCTVHIIDDLGKARSASAVTFCRAHAPRLEARSARSQHGRAK
jgi:hypothetical protein